MLWFPVSVSVSRAGQKTLHDNFDFSFCFLWVAISETFVKKKIMELVGIRETISHNSIIILEDFCEVNLSGTR